MKIFRSFLKGVFALLFLGMIHCGGGTNALDLKGHVPDADISSSIVDTWLVTMTIESDSCNIFQQGEQFQGSFTVSDTECVLENSNQDLLDIQELFSAYGGSVQTTESCQAGETKIGLESHQSGIFEGCTITSDEIVRLALAEDAENLFGDFEAQMSISGCDIPAGFSSKCKISGSAVAEKDSGFIPVTDSDINIPNEQIDSQLIGTWTLEETITSSPDCSQLVGLSLDNVSLEVFESNCHVEYNLSGPQPSLECFAGGNSVVYQSVGSYVYEGCTANVYERIILERNSATNTLTGSLIGDFEISGSNCLSFYGSTTSCHYSGSVTGSLDSSVEGSDDLIAGYDQDGDGSPDDEDCHDNDATIYPGAVEVENDGIDQDCDGSDYVIDNDLDNDGLHNAIDPEPNAANDWGFIIDQGPWIVEDDAYNNCFVPWDTEFVDADILDGDLNDEGTVDIEIPTGETIGITDVLMANLPTKNNCVAVTDSALPPYGVYIHNAN